MKESNRAGGGETAASFEGRKIAVLGGLGFIGSNVALRLAELEADVVAVDALLDGFGGDRRNIPRGAKNLRVEVMDVCDTGLLDLIRGSSLVVNAVGQVSHQRSMSDPMVDLRANCKAQICILEACRRLSPMPLVIYAGTRQVYGRAKELPITESVLPAPVDLNGIHKFAGEEYHRVYHEVFGLPTVRLRLTNTYGPRQSLRAEAQGVIPTFVKRALKGEPLRVFGDGRQRRDATYIDDVVEAVVRVAKTPGAVGSVFNLGSDRPISVGAMAKTIAEAAGVRVELIPYPENLKRIEIGDSWSSYDRLQVACGWRPLVDFATGVAKTIAFYRANPSYWSDA